MPSEDFDTNAAIKNLQAAGVEKKLAEAIVTVIRAAQVKYFASESDIAELKGLITQLRTELKYGTLYNKE